MKKGIYCGWIPCITGRLSFSVIGRFQNNIERIYTRDTDNVNLFCQEHRNPRDGIFERKKRLSFLSSILSNKIEDLKFIFVATGRAGASGFFRKVKGKVFIILGARQEINFSERFLSKNGIFCTDVTIERNGRCYFKNGKVFNNVRWNDGSSVDEVVEYLTSQAFMYLRDVFHRHRHHSPTTDTIIDIYPANGPSWQKKIIFDLTRYIIKYASRNSSGSYENAMGTLAYLKAFRETIGVGQQNNIFSDSNLDTINSSLTIEKMREEASKTLYYWGWGAIIGIVTSVYTLYLSRTDNLSPLDYVLLIVLMGGILLSATWHIGILKLHKLPLILWLNEIMLGRGKFVLPFMLTVLSLLSLLIALYIGYTYIQ